MRLCLNCEDQFKRGERRGERDVPYIGHYCEDCHEHRMENGHLPD